MVPKNRIAKKNITPLTATLLTPAVRKAGMLANCPTKIAPMSGITDRATMVDNFLVMIETIMAITTKNPTTLNQSSINFPPCYLIVCTKFGRRSQLDRSQEKPSDRCERDMSSFPCCLCFDKRKGRANP